MTLNSWVLLIFCVLITIETAIVVFSCTKKYENSSEKAKKAIQLSLTMILAIAIIFGIALICVYGTLAWMDFFRAIIK